MGRIYKMKRNRILALIFVLATLALCACHKRTIDSSTANHQPSGKVKSSATGRKPGSAANLTDDFTRAGIVPGRPPTLPAGFKFKDNNPRIFYFANGFYWLSKSGGLESLFIAADSESKPSSETEGLSKLVIKTESGTDLFSLTKEEVLAEYGPPSDGFDLGKEEGLELSIPGSDYKKPKPGTTYFLSYDFVTGEKAEVSIGFSFELKAHDEMMLTRLTLRYISHDPSSLSSNNKDLPIYKWSKAK